MVGVEGADETGDSSPAASLAKLRPMDLDCHSVLSDASSLVIGKRGEVEPDEAFEP